MWLKIEQQGGKPQALVHVSAYQGLRHFGNYRVFWLPQPVAKWGALKAEAQENARLEEANRGPRNVPCPLSTHTGVDI